MKFLARTNEWEQSHTILSKYLVTRLYQLVDIYEVISYRYPITNGIILLEELYDTATACLKRPKTKDRLKSLLEECIDGNIQTSIINDPVVEKYFRNIKNDLQPLLSKDNKDLDETDIKRLQSISLTYIATLNKKYVEFIFSELKAIDLSSQDLDPKFKKIDRLLKALVAFALHDGHSIIHLKISFKGLIKDSADTLIEQLYRIFSFAQIRNYQFFINNTNLGSELHTQLNTKSDNTSGTYSFDASGKDAFSAFRNKVTTAYRKLGVKNTGININDEIWENVNFLNESTNQLSQLNFIEDRDPIIPLARINTLEESLVKYQKLQNFEDEVLGKIEESLYLYHLALSVPTIENSYVLLWTSLESLMGLRTNEADIKTIKKNVSSILALGAIGRRVNATIQRMRTTANANKWAKIYSPQNDRSANEFDAIGLCHWISWITDQNLKNSPNDPFKDMQSEPLLCKQYRDINENWKKLKDLHTVITLSEQNLNYQLDRLYQTRNRIVHSGRFGRAGNYLWIHLEWYVAKLLAVSILILDNFSFDLDLDANPRDIVFGCLRGQHQSSIDYLKRHEDKIINFDNVLASGITRFPVLCF
ncbi:hypothetical protein [Coleofasciculus sp. FACHB-SPT36]|uniref:hypothetical protein n=1 Tax=Cyanophyceae TaxID=3028117 RepID=UPI00168A8811|nr:hypothetical protein [Coleofasciculus sp. FACHB-SPT36]MBD2538673.1 hypothetical protein [Coleofasciculus sp. FACHB-SPT36]